VKLQIARHNAGAQKRGIRETRNKNENANDREMQHADICTRRDPVPGRMRQESRPATTTAATLANGSDRFAVREPEYS
jgi:hypothetical protein